MRIALIVVIAVAAIFAGGVFYFLLQYIEDVQEAAYLQAQAEKPGIEAVEILVADVDLPAGTVIASQHIDWQPWPDDSLNSDYIVYDEDDPSDDKGDLEDPVYDMIVRRAIMEGEPLTLPKLFEREEATFLSGMLNPGMRAVAIKVKDVTGVGGFIMPGDHVDIIVTIKWKIDKTARDAGLPFTEYTSETVVQNARVMAIDQAFGDFEENAVKVDTVTVEVTPKQAEVLAVAVGKGDLSLSLRSLQPGATGAFAGFTSDREVLYAMGGSIPTTERLAQPVAAPTPRTNVLVAMRDLDAGTLLRDSDFRFAVLEGAVPEDARYFADEDTNVVALRGALVTQAIAADEVLSADKLVRPGTQGFLAAALSPGMRGVSIAVDVVSGISGFISPGDRVDVLMTHELRDIGDNPVLQTRIYTETILQNLRVLAIEQTIDESSGQPVIGRTVTMEVKPKQAETLALGARMGQLSLVLHGATAGAEVEPHEPPFTSDIEISHATTTFIYGTESIYAQPEGPAPSTDAAAPTITVAPTVRSTGSGNVKVYRSTTTTIESFTN